MEMLNEMQFLCSRENREKISGEEHNKMYEKRKELAKSIENEFPIIVEELKQWLVNDSDQC